MSLLAILVSIVCLLAGMFVHPSFLVVACGFILADIYLINRKGE